MFVVVTQILCRDMAFLYSAYICVTTRPFFLVLESLLRHKKVCRDLVYQCSSYLYVATLRSLLRHRNISSALSMSQHWILLLGPGQFIEQASHVATLFTSRNQRFFFFQRRDIHHLIATYTSFSVATYITLSRQRSFYEALLMSQQSFSCCNNQCRDRRSLVAIEFLLSTCFICLE